MPGNNLPEDIEVALRHNAVANNTLETASRNALLNLKGNRPLTDRQQFDTENLWREVNGGTVERVNDLYRLATDPNQAGSVAELESANLGVYRSGAINEFSAGVYLDNGLPSDDGEVRLGFGNNEVDDGLYHVFDSQGWAFTIEALNNEDVDTARYDGEWEQGTVTEKQDSNGDTLGYVYGLDPATGTENSEIEWDPTHGYVYGATVGWYGPSSTLVWVLAISDQGGQWVQRRWPMFLYRPVQQPAISRPNRPIHVSVDSGSTAQDLAVRVGGRQFAYQGDVEPQDKEVFEQASNIPLPEDGTGVGDDDWYPVALIRRSEPHAGVAVGLKEWQVSSTSESTYIHTRVVDPQYITGASWDPPREMGASQTVLEFDIKSDTSTRVDVEAFTDSDGVVKPQGVAVAGDHVGTGAKNTATTGSLLGSLSWPLVRDNPTVLFARTRTGTSAELDVLATLREIA